MTRRSRFIGSLHCLGVAASVLFMASANAASFHCEKAASFSEKAVCADGTLSALDDTLGARYKKAYAAASDKRALAAVRDQEWHWRQTHCHDKACVFDWYQRRIAELDADLDPAALAKPAVVSEPATDVTTASGRGSATTTATTAASSTPARTNSPAVDAASVAVPVHSETHHLHPGMPSPIDPISSATGPLPPDFSENSSDTLPIAMQKPLDVAAARDVLPLPPTRWAAPSPMLSETQTPGPAQGYRLFNKGERASARTVGIFVGF